jgi:hypothetical protein
MKFVVAVEFCRSIVALPPSAIGKPAPLPLSVSRGHIPIRSRAGGNSSALVVNGE